MATDICVRVPQHTAASDSVYVCVRVYVSECLCVCARLCEREYVSGGGDGCRVCVWARVCVSV